MNRRYGILLLAATAMVFAISCASGGDVTGAILITALFIPTLWRNDMMREQKCLIRYSRTGRPYFIHNRKRYYFDEIWQNGIPAMDYAADFRVKKIEYGIEDYAVLVPLKGVEK